jgi:predicted kinase
MSGAPGSGKTTIARAVVRRHGAVSLDHDIVKSALLAAGCRFDDAGRASYGVLLALADDLLRQGHRVIVDSPCHYDGLLAAGLRLATAHGVRYRYVECVTDDVDLLDRRLRARRALRSQRRSVGAPPVDLPADRGATGVGGAELFRWWIANMKRPTTRYLRLDTTRPVGVCVPEVSAFLETRYAEDPL